MGEPPRLDRPAPPEPVGGFGTNGLGTQASMQCFSSVAARVGVSRQVACACDVSPSAENVPHFRPAYVGGARWLQRTTKSTCSELGGVGGGVGGCRNVCLGLVKEAGRGKLGLSRCWHGKGVARRASSLAAGEVEATCSQGILTRDVGRRAYVALGNQWIWSLRCIYLGRVRVYGGQVCMCHDGVGSCGPARAEGERPRPRYVVILVGREGALAKRRKRKREKVIQVVLRC